MDVVCVGVSVSLGFGKHVAAIEPKRLPTIQILGNVSSSASILAAVWGKTSFGITLLRIAEGGKKLVIWLVIVSMNLLMISNALLAWIQCDPVSKNWNPEEPGTCWDPRAIIVYGVVAGCRSRLSLPLSLTWVFV